MTESNAAVGISNSSTEAESGINELQNAGLDRKKLSIVGLDCPIEEPIVRYYHAGDRMKVWGKLGAFWGGLWGPLLGSTLSVIPGLGSLGVFSPLVSWMVGALVGALVVGGLSALAAALYSIGLPQDSSLQSEKAVKSKRLLVITHGTGVEVASAKTIL